MYIMIFTHILSSHHHVSHISCCTTLLSLSTLSPLTLLHPVSHFILPYLIVSYRIQQSQQPMGYGQGPGQSTSQEGPIPASLQLLPLYAMSLQVRTPHYTTLYYTTLHFTTLYYIALHCTTQHYITQRYSTVQFCVILLQAYFPHTTSFSESHSHFFLKSLHDTSTFGHTLRPTLLCISYFILSLFAL